MKTYMPAIKITGVVAKTHMCESHAGYYYQKPEVDAEINRLNKIINAAKADIESYRHQVAELKDEIRMLT